MTIATASLHRTSLRDQLALSAVPEPEPQTESDQRRYVRFDLNLLGRFMRADKQEYPCRISSMSVGDATFMAPVDVEVGERIIAYIDEIGGIEGVVNRVEDGSFALEISATQHKRQKLAAQITWLINRSELEGMDARRPGHDRLSTLDKSTLLRVNGKDLEVSLLDVSISGASILIAERPPLGTEVMLGKLRARIVRHHADGIGVQFLDIQNPDALRRYFG